MEITDWQTAQEGINFKIANASAYNLYIESTWKLFIERLENEDWVKMPFVPCQCGTPCKEPQATLLESGDSLEIRWNFISRKCTFGADVSPETVEERVKKGKYRMIFVLNPSKDGKRLNSEKLEVYFKAK